MKENNVELNSSNLVNFDKSAELDLSIKSLKNDLIFNVLPNVNVTLNLKDFDEENNFTFNVSENSNMTVRIINESGKKSFKVKGDVKENSSLNIVYADLSDSTVNFDSNVNLLEKNAKGMFKFCSVANLNNVKKYNICFEQVSPMTSSLFEGYGVSLKNGVIDAKGISHITKDSIKCEANQKVKVILFDKESKAKASPTLRCDCDDIVANHACAIGSLNEDHIFYLKSRGLSEQEARKLITLGYLIPIEDFFNDKEKEMIAESIKEIF